MVKKKNSLDINYQLYFIYLVGIDEDIFEKYPLKKNILSLFLNSKLVQDSKSKRQTKNKIKRYKITSEGKALYNHFLNILKEYYLFIAPLKYTDLSTSEVFFETYWNFSTKDEWGSSMDPSIYNDLRYSLAQYKNIPFHLFLYLDYFYIQSYQIQFPSFDSEALNTINNILKIETETYLKIKDFNYLELEKPVTGESVIQNHISHIYQSLMYLYQKETYLEPPYRFFTKDAIFNQMSISDISQSHLYPFYSHKSWQVFNFSQLEESPINSH